jgi:hypothetical protein
METPRSRRISEIKGLENFHDYTVDVNGNVYSLKYNKRKRLKPGWAKKRDGYLFVRISDIKGNKKNFLIHRLVAMAFIKTDDNDFSMRIGHKNNNIRDNRIENLEWMKPKIRFIEEDYKASTLILEKVKEVHMASIRKGLPISKEDTFINTIIGNALDSYIKQYGLRKVMNFSDGS